MGEDAQAFGQAAIKLNATPFHVENSLDRFWQAGKAIGLEASTPFYFGTVSLGISSLAFESLAIPQPDFKTNLYYFKWGFPIYGIKILNVEGGFLLGNLKMDFQEASPEGASTLSESEFTLGLMLSGTVRLSRQITLYSEFRRNTVFTRKKFYLGQITTGLAWEFGTPNWLRRFLRGD